MTKSIAGIATELIFCLILLALLSQASVAEEKVTEVNVRDFGAAADDGKDDTKAVLAVTSLQGHKEARTDPKNIMSTTAHAVKLKADNLRIKTIPFAVF